MELVVYLAGQIHDDWREQFRNKIKEKKLSIQTVGPQENHDRSDEIGELIKGTQPNAIYRDEAASELNNLRTSVLMNKADVVVALFGTKYRQWNTAMDAATAIQLGKPVILVRPEEFHHALKELSNKSQVVVETLDQAVDALAYILE
ncbi:YtoQ family protein [Chengkuizengella axinellae]|uniref:YtoQ family protein n=1 Tax=Chengkuizengella axinellae TaxID=3064388 RepID=A0ABT9IZG7_9BACL|nr:YtoQ family protein [Chengkuizengella sp. 2205SS18-9]MDP5274700.1 YtoQ family protein [Chengkuizengella sp. 2205SS18-9]